MARPSVTAWPAWSAASLPLHVAAFMPPENLTGQIEHGASTERQGAMPNRPGAFDTVPLGIG
jgi:hypothetical protein